MRTSKRIPSSLALLGAVLAVPGAAWAQASREVPITRDLNVERRLDRNAQPALDPNVTPDNPDGVVGFDGPPCTLSLTVAGRAAWPMR